MKPKRSNETYTLEEILTLSDNELVSNWTKLASLIRAYEKSDWEQSKKKALELKNEGAAFGYIKTVRAYPDGIISKPEEPEKKESVKPSKPAKAKPVFKTPLTVYEKNYNRLLQIAPDLEEKLAHFDPKSDYVMYGKSVKTGFMDFNLEMIHYDETGFYFAMSQYYLQNGDLVPDPDMLVLIDLKNRTVQALHIQNAMYYKQVYVDNYDRKLVNLAEKKSQNAFLTIWLRNLKSQFHKIEWKKESDEFVPSSIIVDEYQKKSEEEIESKPTKKEIESNEKETVLPTQIEVEKTITTEPIIESPTIEVEQKVEVIESAKKTKMAIEFSEEQTKKLSSIVLFLEGVKTKLPDVKANELIESGKALDYLINGYEEVKADKLLALMEANYYKLKLVIPQVYFDKGNETKTLVISPTISGSTTSYYFSEVTTQKNKNIKQFAIYESASETRSGGTLLLGIREGEKQAWVESISEEFDGKDDYFDDTEKVVSDQRYFVNKQFGKWLDYILRKRYEPTWLEKGLKEEIDEIKNGGGSPSIPAVETPIIKLPVAEIPSTESVKVEVDTPTKKKPNPNDEIPDFEIGKVKLTEQHKKHGLTQRDINWINRHKQGMTIIPRTKIMVHNTKDRLMDQAIQAKQPGFRISATGKFYYEGRSNRSDRTRQGL